MDEDLSLLRMEIESGRHLHINQHWFKYIPATLRLCPSKIIVLSNDWRRPTRQVAPLEHATSQLDAKRYLGALTTSCSRCSCALHHIAIPKDLHDEALRLPRKTTYWLRKAKSIRQIRTTSRWRAWRWPTYQVKIFIGRQDWVKNIAMDGEGRGGTKYEYRRETSGVRSFGMD